MENSKIPLLVHIEVVSDRSGSMHTMKNTPTVKLKELIEDQINISKETGGDIQMSITSFDDISETYYENIDVIKLKEISDEMWCSMMNPRGSTRLIDTVLERIESQEKYVNNYEKSLSKEVKNLNPEIKRMLVVLTDGKDNNSKHKEGDLNIKLKKLRENGLIAIFLGANQDAIKSGNIYGFSQDTSLTIGSDYLTCSRGMGYVNNLCRSVSSGESSSCPLRFTEIERMNSVSICEVIKEEDILPPPPPLPPKFRRSIRPNSPVESPPDSPPTPVSSHVSPNGGMSLPNYNFEEQTVIEALLSLKNSNK